jgi:hypothetical protein
MRMLVSLQRPVARRMTIDAARMLDHFAGLAKQSSRALVRILNRGKCGCWPQLGRGLLRNSCERHREQRDRSASAERRESGHECLTSVLAGTNFNI